MIYIMREMEGLSEITFTLPNTPNKCIDVLADFTSETLKHVASKNELDEVYFRELFISLLRRC